MRIEFALTEGEPQPTNYVRGFVAESEIPFKIAEFLGEVGEYLESRGIEVTGLPYTRYHGEQNGLIDMEAGVPLDIAQPDSGVVRAGELPGGEAACASYWGDYSGLGAAAVDLTAWVLGQGRTINGPMWQVYVTDPGDTDDRNDWHTDLYAPLA